MKGTETGFAESFVRALSRTERQLLMLHYAEELSPAEIGLVLNLGESRVKLMLDSLRRRARAALRVRQLVFS
ncbi:MAG: sigma factor-like helix-turn-helix DNA-binding protein [Planctomycetota bacterium]